MIDIVRHVFIKDGRELLRDRRTIFVNVVLPVLLYPILALFGIQVMQLTQTDPADLPRVATINAPTALTELLGKRAYDPEDEAADQAMTYVMATLDSETTTALTTIADTLRTTDKQGAGDDNDAGDESSAQQREAALALMRGQDVSAVIACSGVMADVEDPLQVVVIADHAHRYHPQLTQALNRIFSSFEQDLVDQRLATQGLPKTFIHPLDRITVEAAPKSEALRVRIAGVIPLLLVLMALSGAFYPALDLIAGERERGTLESLLAWPGDRRAIFLGKLLVVIVAALVSVILNLGSLAITAVILGSQSGVADGAIGNLASGLSLGAGVLFLCLAALLPLVVTLAAVSLAIAGFAASFKEAQNYLSPLFIVVMVPAFTTMIPAAKPGLILDLVPVVGPLLALKEGLQSPSIPWGHLLLATAGSTALAMVVVGWSIRLFDQERFLYPGLVRAGWGRFRKWGSSPPAPSGLEALAVYAVALALFLYLGPAFLPLGPVAMVVLPLAVGIGLPAILHWWLGAYDARTTLAWRAPSAHGWLRALALTPLAVALSLALFALQVWVAGEPPAQVNEQIGDPITDIFELGGYPLLLLCVAVTPGICEELLCRGPVLSGLRRGLGTTAAVLVSAFLFAALHGSPYRFLPQMVVGIVLAILVIRSGSIWTAMLLHAGHNAMAVGLAAAVGASEEPLFSPGMAILVVTLAGIGVWVTLRCGGNRSMDTDATIPSAAPSTSQSAGPGGTET